MLPGTALAQKEDSGAKNPPIDIKNAVDKGVAMPTPLDKFLALTLLVKTKDIDWNGTFNAVAVDIDPDKFTDKEVLIPELLGIRIADGVMAIQAKDAEMLGKAASDIEKLADKLDEKIDLTRAKRVRTMANEGKWMDVFRELGFLQQDIMKKLEEKPNDPRSSLLMITGWIQGSRYSSKLISAHYSDASSNILREPLLVAALQAKVDKLPENVKSSPSVSKISSSLPRMKEIVNVGIDKPIAKKNVDELQTLATDCIKAIISK
ncbi:MAG: hypothetical protein QM755_08045 [Luteolibacter sp.]